MKRITHERLSNYTFTGSILLLMIIGTTLQIIYAPVHWGEILMHRVIPIVISSICYWLLSRSKLALRLIHSVKNVKLLAILLPFLLLTGSQYLYHSVLFPILAIFGITTSIYIFQDDPMENALFGIVVTTLVFAATAVMRGNHLVNALTIFAGGAVMLITCYDLEWFFIDAHFIRTKQCIALLVLATALLFSELCQLCRTQ